MNKKSKDYIHKEYPKLCDPKDFFGQVKRTVNGKPVSEKQIKLIVESIISRLSLNADDYLLDIGCGNAALAARLFNTIRGYTGIDFSEYLIKIGRENFEKPGYELILSDALEYLKNTKINSQITKILCYGVFSYFSKDTANELLTLITLKFPSVTKIYIGNIPDKSRANNFFYKDIDYSLLLDNHETDIGKWWLKSEFSELAQKIGWDVDVFNMPIEFYSAHYRFDAILKK